MKNKIFMLALLVLFVSVLFLGCGGDNAKPVKEFTVTAMTGDGYYGKGSYLISWEARGQNVDGFGVYFMEKDKPSSIWAVARGTNRVVYSASGGSTVNSDFDKWNARVWSAENPSTYLHSLEGHFGVRAASMMGISDYSNIVWSKDTYKINADW